MAPRKESNPRADAEESESTSHAPPSGLASADRFEQVFLAGPDGLIIVDGVGRIKDANPMAEEMFGFEAKELLGQPVEILIPEELRSSHINHRMKYMDQPATRPMGVGIELLARRADGSEFPVEISLSPIAVDGEVGVIATIRDISEIRRRRAYQSATLRAAEEERRRLARELHDDTAQMLAALLLRLRVASRAEEPRILRTEMAGLRKSIAEIAEGVRRIARGLRPPALEDAGLVAAIQAHVRSQVGRLPIDATFDLEPVETEISEEEKLVLYRIVQEALSNAIRHGHPRTIAIRLLRRPTEVVAEVVDDGIGFARHPRSLPDSGLGFMGMRERTEMVAGTLEVESSPGRGTTVRLRIPTSAHENPDQSNPGDLDA